MLKKIILTLISSLLLTNTFSQELSVSNESEFSAIKTGGNTVLQAYNLNTHTKFDFQKYIYTFGGHYFLSLYEGVDTNNSPVQIESARNWDISLKFEKNMSKRLNFFTQVQFEGNSFAGFEQRDNYDIGAKHKVIHTKKERISTEMGYRYSVEHKGSVKTQENSIVPSSKLRFYIEYEKQQTATLSYKFWIEYLPNLTHEEDYMINIEPSLSLYVTNIFSFKFAFAGSYDNSPADPSHRMQDFKYTTSLLAKY